jgi:hypothetical protein
MCDSWWTSHSILVSTGFLHRGELQGLRIGHSCKDSAFATRGLEKVRGYNKTDNFFACIFVCPCVVVYYSNLLTNQL